MEPPTPPIPAASPTAPVSPVSPVSPFPAAAAISGGPAGPELADATPGRPAPPVGSPGGAEPHPQLPLPAAEQPPPARVFLSAREVGLQLGIRKSRVYELAAAGLLPVVRMGRRMLFPCHGLEALAAAAIERTRAEVLGAGTSYPAPTRAVPSRHYTGSSAQHSGPAGRRAA